MLLNEPLFSLNKRGGQQRSSRGWWDLNRTIFEINCQFHSACVPEDSHTFFYLLWNISVFFIQSIFFILIFFYSTRIQTQHVFFACKLCTQSLTFREILVRMWHASIQNLKEIFFIQATPRPSIWFCLVKARRDWNSPIKINLKLIMAQSEGPDSSCLYMCCRLHFLPSVF